MKEIFLFLTLLSLSQFSSNTINAGPLSQLPTEFDTMSAKRAETNPTRFKTIKISQEQALDEINFWSRQLSEHALFLHLGLEEEPFKKQGQEIHNKFENYRKNLTPANMAEILPLAKELRDYKVQVLTTLNSGKWIGWIFPLFARHIILELDYFVDKLNGIKYSDRDEVAFWNVINGEHAGFAAHLLDPSERDLFLKGDKLSQEFNPPMETETDMLIEISLKAAKELDAYNRKAEANIKTIKSVIHPVLIAHVVREGQRSIDTLDKLQDKTGAIYPQDNLF